MDRISFPFFPSPHCHPCAYVPPSSRCIPSETVKHSSYLPQQTSSPRRLARQCAKKTEEMQRHLHNKVAERAEFSKWARKNKVRIDDVPADGDCLFEASAMQKFYHSVACASETDHGVGKTVEFLQHRRKASAQEIKMKALQYMWDNQAEFKDFISIGTPGQSDLHAAIAQDFDDFVGQMAQPGAFGDMNMLQAIARSQKRDVQVLKFDEVGTGVDQAGMSTVFFAGKPESQSTPDVRSAIRHPGDLLLEKDTWSLLFWAFEYGIGEGHYKSVVPTSVSESSLEPLVR